MNIAQRNGAAVARQIERASQRLQAQCGFCEFSAGCGGATPDLVLLEKGEYVYRNGDRDDHLYCVRRGSVKTCRHDLAGEEQVMGFHFAGELFGIEGLLLPSRDSAAVALESTLLCRLPMALPQPGEPSSSDPAQLLRLLGTEILHARERALVNRRQAGVRLAAFLLDIAGRTRYKSCRDGVVFPLPMNRYEIASYLGLTVETVCRRLCHMERDQLVEISDRRKMVQLLDVDRLRQVVYPDTRESC